MHRIPTLALPLSGSGCWDNYNVGSVNFGGRVADSCSGGSRYRQPMPEYIPAILSTSHHAGYKLAMETIWKPNTFGGEWGVGKPFYKWAKGPMFRGCTTGRPR